MKSVTIVLVALFVAVLPARLARAQGPVVTVVTGPAAPELERFAAGELAGIFRKLFQAEVTIADAVPVTTGNLVLLGSPETNPAVAEVAGAQWPADLTAQGHLLKSVGKGDAATLVVGGGSPVATLWAVYELGHHFGMRYLLHGDFPPIDEPEFSLAGFETVLEPNLETRAWRTIDSGAAGQESWGLADHEKLIGQLAKLKFNRVILAVHPSQPYSDFESGDAEQKSDGVLWGGKEFPVSGDTAGRSVFGGAKVFENPDFAEAETAADRVAAARKLAEGIFAAARKRGMSVSMEPADADPGDLEILSLGQVRGGLLPHHATSRLPDRLAAIRGGGGKGFAVKCWIPGELDPDVYFLSRASFDAEATPEESLESLVTPICGEGVAERLAVGFAAIEAAAAVIGENDAGFAVPDPRMFLEHYESSEPAPEWWAEAKGHYVVAVNEMYRGNTRARGGARPFILYHAKRYTFALHYLTAVETARAAGVARAAGDEDAWIENLELSVEAMHNALGIYAEVARDNSDRGVIAVLNEYAYRPLIAAFDEVP